VAQTIAFRRLPPGRSPQSGPPPELEAGVHLGQVAQNPNVLVIEAAAVIVCHHPKSALRHAAREERHH